MFTLFIFVFIVTPGRVVKNTGKEKYCEHFDTPWSSEHFTVLNQVLFVVFF